MSDSLEAPATSPATDPVPYALDPGTPAPAPPPPRWPGPAMEAGPAPVVAVALAGLLAAALVPLGRPGLGWVLGGLAVAAAVTVAVRRPGPDLSRPAEPSTLSGRRGLEPAAWTGAALALLAVGAVRAAGWVFVLSVLAAAAATVAALTSGRSLRGLALGAVLVPAAAVRGAGWAYRGAVRLRRRAHPTLRLGRTAAATVLVLLVFGALLSSADEAFSRLLSHALPAVDTLAPLRWTVLFALGAGVALAGAFLCLAPPRLDEESDPPGAGDPTGAGQAATGRDRGRLVEWAVPVGALVALFTAFVGVQLTVLFGGASYVLGPDGPTYAEYARGGFWQLLTVTTLTLMLIGVVARIAPRRTATERWWLRGLLGPLALLTLVIVASALLRMHTYQQAYGFTRLRVLVSVVELWLGLVFLLFLAAGVRLRARWLPRAVLATGMVAVLALAALNPDRFIAERNIDRWADGGHHVDVAYLARLSPDAAPVLVCLPEPYREHALSRVRARLAVAPDGWREANLGRAAARRALADPASLDCPDWDDAETLTVGSVGTVRSGA